MNNATRCMVFAILVTLTACATRQQMPLVSRCGKGLGADRSGAALAGQSFGRPVTPIPLNSVQFADTAGAKSVAVQDIFVSRQPTGTVELTARFISCADTPITLRLRTNFLRDDSSPAEPATAWETLNIAPHLPGTYTSKSTSVTAANYLVEVASGHLQ